MRFPFFPEMALRGECSRDPHERKRLRTAKTGNCLSEKPALRLVHQLAISAEK